MIMLHSVFLRLRKVEKIRIDGCVLSKGMISGICQKMVEQLDTALFLECVQSRYFLAESPAASFGTNLDSWYLYKIVAQNMLRTYYVK